ncbi:hypothetical protein NSQ54_10330 [Alkalihalobacillus sp. FSL W8-0930]
MDIHVTEMEKCFLEAKKAGNCVAVLVEMDGFPEPEIIINPTMNIDSKLAYYKKTYDEKLQHRFAQGIRIIDFTSGKDFAAIQRHFHR